LTLTRRVTIGLIGRERSGVRGRRVLQIFDCHEGGGGCHQGRTHHSWGKDRTDGVDAIMRGPPWLLKRGRD